MNKWYLGMALATLMPAIAGAGVVYEITVTNHDIGHLSSRMDAVNEAAANASVGGNTPNVDTMVARVDEGNLKMETISAGRGDRDEMIYRGDRRQMIAVDHGDRSYAVIDGESIKAVSRQVQSVMPQIEEALKNVPEDKRAMMEEMLKRRMPQQPPAAAAGPSFELRKTGERASHSGYPCVKYDVIQDGRKAREMWVTDWDNVEGGREVAATFEDMADFFAELRNAMPRFGQRGGDDNMFQHMKEIGGFPVVTREFGEDGDVESETTLRSAKRMTIDPDAFEPPSGYKRQEMFGGG